AVLVALFPTAIAQTYMRADDPQNTQTIAFILAFLPIAAAFMIFDAVQLVANQLLRGIKDVTVPMILTGISYWIIGFPLCFYLGLHTAYGPNGVWYGLMAGLIAASIGLGIRLVQRLRVPPRPPELLSPDPVQP
ncbi:MAG: MATE family efflux transporter, partial [Pseudomonadota bacterium]